MKDVVFVRIKVVVDTERCCQCIVVLFVRVLMGKKRRVLARENLDFFDYVTTHQPLHEHRLREVSTECQLLRAASSQSYNYAYVSNAVCPNCNTIPPGYRAVAIFDLVYTIFQ